MNYTLVLIEIILAGLPSVALMFVTRYAVKMQRALKAAKAQQRKAEKAARDAEAQLKQLAERESMATERNEIIPATTEQTAEPAEQAAPAPKIHGNNAFTGHVVAFTGKLPGMTRREAIEAVRRNGGKAFKTMPAATTILVVGDKPGMCKMDKADEWIDRVRKITAAQFFEMLNQPLTMEPDEFAAMFAAQFAA